MKQIHILASLAILLGWANMARAQASLGSPRVPSQETIASEPHPVVETPASRHRSCFPLFSHVKRTRFTPLRSALANLFPSPPPAPPPSDVPTREDIGRMVSEGWHSPAEISAAKIKLDEAQSKFRCAAVRYLATIDCHYYPEAELGLIAALRADRVEAVRLEAAQAMGQCPSVTLRMTEALQLTAQGFDTDGNPPENSERVRLAARAALQRQWSLMTPPVNDQPMPPGQMPPGQPPPEWYLQPQPTHPTTYLPPTYSSQPQWSANLAEERQRAATVSTHVPGPRGPRSWHEYLTMKSAQTPIAETPRGPSSWHEYLSMKSAQPQASEAPRGPSSWHEYLSMKSAQTPIAETPRGPQSWYEFLTSRPIGRELFCHTPPTPESVVTTRMRGLRPLGSEASLAIPTTSLPSR